MRGRHAIRIALLGVGLAASAHAAPKILICAADANMGGADLQKKLQASMAFALVDLADCSKITPALDTLKTYDGVFTFSDTQYADRATLGDHLADYVDAGGGVVLGQFSLSAGFGIELTGRWSMDNYNCITPGKVLYANSTSKPAPNDPMSPVVQNVTSITSQYRVSAQVNGPRGARSVWDYADGASLVCVMAVNGHPRVDLNFYPGPVPQFYTEGQPGDGALLVKNALLAVAGGFNPFKGMPDPIAFPDTGTGAVSNAVTVTYANASKMAQTVTSATVGGANAADFIATRVPQLPLVVQPAQTLSIDVVFQPQSGGARVAALQLGVAGQMSTGDVMLLGNGIPSSVKITPFPIVTGGTHQGMPIKMDVTIANVGLGKMTIENATITLGQAAYSIINAPAFPVALGAGGTFPVTLTFNPQMDGVTDGTLTVKSTDPNTPTINVPITGYAGAPALTLDVGSIAFGSVNLGASLPQTVTATNSGFSNLVMNDIVIAGLGDFLVDKMMIPGAVIAPQHSLPFTLTFKPLKLGARSATVTVSSSVPDATITVFGTGTMATLGVAPNMLTFAPVHLKTPSAPGQLTISNGGDGTLAVKSLTFGGMDAISFKQSGDPMAPFTVAANSSAQVPIVCQPQTFGKLTATATVATDVGSLDVALAGEGTAPVFALTPASLDFGQVRVLATSAMPVTLGNHGTDDLTIRQIRLDGADASDFLSKDLPTLPLLLKPNATSTFHVDFSPSKNAVESAELDLATDDPMAPAPILAMTGTGIQAGVTIAPMSIDFGPTLVSTTSAPRPIVITNTGDSAIKIDTIKLGGAAPTQFTVDEQGPITVDKGTSATLMVAYSPMSLGAHGAMITISATGLIPIVINLKGSGVNPTLLVSPTELDFGSIDVDMKSEAQTVGIKNASSTPIAIDSIVSGDPVFTIDAISSMMLTPNATATFNVTFAPTDGKHYSTSIAIVVKGAASTTTQIPAKGYGIPCRCPPKGCGCAIGAREDRRPLALSLLFLIPLVYRRRTKRKNRATKVA